MVLIMDVHGIERNLLSLNHSVNTDFRHQIKFQLQKDGLVVVPCD